MATEKLRARAIWALRRIFRIGPPIRAIDIGKFSHELRTPLNVILGAAGNLQTFQEEGLLEPDYLKQELERISSNARILEARVNTMLDFIRSTSPSGIKLNRELFLVFDVVNKAMASVEQAVQEKGLELVCEECDPHTKAYGDEAKVQQILENFLVNAKKFTDSGGKITVKWGETSEEIWISVQDTGMGIPRKKLGTIFKEFYQVDRLNSPTGLGLGLAYCRELAWLMGGDIEVQSVVGDGSTFTLVLNKRSGERR